MLAHQRMIFDAMKPVLKIDNPEDWYNVTSKAAFQAGGQAVIRTHYDSSLTRALMSIYPEHEWHEWKFHRGPHGWWSSFENQHRYIQWLEKQVGITSLAQWYSIPQSILKNNHGSFVAFVTMRRLPTVYIFMYLIIWTRFDASETLQWIG
jgi:hypothetical protein